MFDIKICFYLNSQLLGVFSWIRIYWPIRIQEKVWCGSEKKEPGSETLKKFCTIRTWRWPPQRWIFLPSGWWAVSPALSLVQWWFRSQTSPPAGTGLAPSWSGFQSCSMKSATGISVPSSVDRALFITKTNKSDIVIGVEWPSYLMPCSCILLPDWSSLLENPQWSQLKLIRMTSL